MSDSSIRPKPINELRKESFHIPGYQRGYRWTKDEVVDLLKDVSAFQGSEQSLDPRGFYCLQPLVVKKRVGGERCWEVVDGQQRLTTIFLLLQYFNQLMVEEERIALFDLDFETRPGSRAYLSRLDPAGAEGNIDFHFMYLAHSAIKDWFAGRKNERRGFEDVLLNRVKVIWYELAEGQDPIDAFTRLNVGKIPLTDPELVRALFLRSKNFKAGSIDLAQLKIAQEWDLMEKDLQGDDFWFFISADRDVTNRIGLVFALMTEAVVGKPQEGERLTSFHHFNRQLSENGVPPDVLWDEVKVHFMTLKEWYLDRELFHLIGYLINEHDSVLELVTLSRQEGKEAFRRLLKARIWKRALKGAGPEGQDAAAMEAALREKLEGLEYGTRTKEIKSLLLLFNIASILANDQSILRFRFDFYKNEDWDIEHIRSVSEGRPRSNADRKPWLEVMCHYFSGTGASEDLFAKARLMLEEGTYTHAESFDALYGEILRSFGEDEPQGGENGIGNLAILDQARNRGYKNAAFPVKREWILQGDREGTFVPLCTRNVFLKAYSRKVDKMQSWDDADRQAYLDAIVATLVGFFQPQK